MKFDPQKHHRRSIRWTGHDYSQTGAYFVTVCTEDRVCRFGDVLGGEMHLNDAGRTVQALWDGLSVRFESVELDAFVVMPNHVHGILLLAGVEAPLVGAPSGAAGLNATPKLGAVVGAYKSLVTVEYTRSIRMKAWPPSRGRLWQRNYYEHIVRNDYELARIRQYIFDNPTRWELDPENPVCPRECPKENNRPCDPEREPWQV